MSDNRIGILFWSLALVILIFASLTACGSPALNPADYELPDDAVVQFIVPIYTAEEVSGVTAERNVEITLDQIYDRSLDNYNLLVNDTWTLCNDTNETKALTVAHVWGQWAGGTSSSTGYGTEEFVYAIKVNGKELDTTEFDGCTWRVPSASGDNKSFSVVEIRRKLTDKEFLESSFHNFEGQPRGSGKGGVNITFIKIELQPYESTVIEYLYELGNTYRVDFLPGKYNNISCDEATVTLKKTDLVRIFKQNMGFDEDAETSTMTLDPDMDDYYIDYRVEYFGNK